MNDSLNNLLEKLLLSNNFSFDKEELELQIKSHPSYPSLHAITGVLDHFGVENLALDVPQTLEVFNQLPNAFIAQIKTTESEDLVFIKKKNEKEVILYASNNKKQQISITDFLTQWSGIIVVIEKDELLTSDKKDLQSYSKGLKVLLGGIILFSIVVYSFTSTFGYIHFILSLVGLFVSYLLVKHELGLNSSAVNKLCTTTEKTSCDAVLHSKGSKVLGRFKLSDVSFVYFLGLSLNWALLLISGMNNYNLITILSISAIPVIIYSIYYQGAVVKKWCPLCLAVGSILMFQVVTVFLFNSFEFQFSTKGILLFVSSFLISILVYGYLKSLIKVNLKLKDVQIKAYKFKRNSSIFNALYKQNPILNTTIDNIQEIQFGNPKASFKVVLITNPLCGFCKAKHQALDKLLQTNNQDINAIIRFNIGVENKENTGYQISNILLNIYNKDKKLCKEALYKIYTDGVDVNKWLATYKKYNTTDYFVVLDAEKKWCIDNNINFTPAVFLNSREFPKEYEISDLPLFIDELEVAENQNDTNELMISNQV